jgi:hypothetical protein
VEGTRPAVEHRQLRRRLSAGGHDAALVGRLRHGLEQPTLASHTCPIAPLALAGFEPCLGVIQHQQAAPLAEDAQQGRRPFRVARRQHQLLIGQEADGASQPFSKRWRIAEATPVDALEARRRLPPDGQAAGLEQRLDQGLESQRLGS